MISTILHVVPTGLFHCLSLTTIIVVDIVASAVKVEWLIRGICGEVG